MKSKTKKQKSQEPIWYSGVSIEGIRFDETEDGFSVSIEQPKVMRDFSEWAHIQHIDRGPAVALARWILKQPGEA